MPGENEETGAFAKRTFASYTGKTLVRFIAQGAIVKMHIKSKSLTTITPVGEAVGGGCYGYVVVDFRKAGNLYGGGWAGLCNQPLVTTLVLEGTGTAHRVAWYLWNGFEQCGGTGQPSCFAYAGGSHNVQLIPTAQKLQLVVDSSSVTTGSTVRFTVRRSDGGSFTVQSWTWKPLTRVSNPGTTTASTYGPSASGCSVGANICDAMMTNTETAGDTTASPQRGIMYVRALVNGITETARAEVTVRRGQLRLAADPTEVFARDTVTFTPSTLTGQPYRVLVWAWVPDTLPGQSAGCSTNHSICRTPIYESGVMFLTAEVGGRNERASARVKARPDRVEIVPAASEIKPAMPGVTGTSTSVSISVIGGDGQPVPNANVTLRLIADYTSAGHTGSHVGPKPTGTIPVSVNTGPTGVTSVTYTAHDVSGPVTIEGTSPGVRTGTAVIRVRIGGLAQLQFNSAMDPQNFSNIHPSNHWGTSAMNDALTFVANTLVRVREEFNKLPVEQRPSGTWLSRFGINDISLTDGGRFDIDGNWLRPHGEHGLGQEADVDVRRNDAEHGLNYDNYALVVQVLWQDWVRGQVRDERAARNHFHLRLVPRTSP